MNIQERLAAAFQAEHREHLQAVRAMLQDVAVRAYDSRGFDFAEAYRRVHSLKGAARAVGLPGVERLSHRLESVVDRCQKGTLALDGAVSAAIQRAFDDVEDWAATLADHSAAQPRGDGLAALEGVLGLAPTPPPPAPAPVADAAPTAEAPAPARALDHADDTVRVNLDALDAVLRQSGEIVTETGRQDRIAADLRRLRHDLGSMRLGDDALDRSLGDILARLKDVNEVQADAAWRLRKLGAQLHTNVRDLRIVPAEDVFGGYRKMIRDLARDAGKEIDVEVGGLDVLVDRNVLQRLRDPVLHLLRNAVDHGVEAPDARAARGKPRAGRVSLTLSTSRGRLLVAIEDDGAGLDRGRIAAEAARRGLSADDFGGVLVHAGFSTAERLTELSGRGIGLSIVDQAARRMRGTFDIAPREPYGTRAIIVVPLSISGERVLIVYNGAQAYCIPVHAVERVRRVATDEITMIGGKPFIAAAGGGDPVPLAMLSQILARAGAMRGDGRMLRTVLLHGDDQRLALVVDGFGAIDDALVHDLEPAVANLRFADGSVVLRDGSAAFLLNPQALVRAWRALGHAESLDVTPAAERDAPSEILVVDDSITTRTLEKSILEATGFRVRLSTDGMDALEQLRQKPADLVIADVEMPRMDGFGLLQAVRGDPALKAIPLILVTSRDDPADRQKGLTLGAQAYIIKQRFDQRDLLAAIEQIL